MYTHIFFQWLIEIEKEKHSNFHQGFHPPPVIENADEFALSSTYVVCAKLVTHKHNKISATKLLKTLITSSVCGQSFLHNAMILFFFVFFLTKCSQALLIDSQQLNAINRVLLDLGCDGDGTSCNQAPPLPTDFDCPSNRNGSTIGITCDMSGNVNSMYVISRNCFHILFWLTNNLRDLNGRDLRGFVSTYIGFLSKLQLINVGNNNQITGTIPAQIGSCIELIEL